jgi:histidyl-tRNA synthetase
LDYYTKTVFEICATGIGAQNALCGGGRYDGLIEAIGGEHTPAMGVALGLERVFSVLASQNEDIELKETLDVFVVCDINNALTAQIAFTLAVSLRQSGFSALMEYEAKSIKSQLKTANRLQASYTVIIGEEEANKGTAQVKNMESGEQTEMPLNEIKQFLLI